MEEMEDSREGHGTLKEHAREGRVPQGRRRRDTDQAGQVRSGQLADVHSPRVILRRIVRPHYSRPPLLYI